MTLIHKYKYVALGLKVRRQASLDFAKIGINIRLFRRSSAPELVNEAGLSGARDTGREFLQEARHVVYVVRLPPRLSQRQRDDQGDFDSS